LKSVEAIFGFNLTSSQFGVPFRREYDASYVAISLPQGQRISWLGFHLLQCAFGSRCAIYLD